MWAIGREDIEGGVLRIAIDPEGDSGVATGTASIGKRSYSAAIRLWLAWRVRRRCPNVRRKRSGLRDYLIRQNWEACGMRGHFVTQEQGASEVASKKISCNGSSEVGIPIRRARPAGVRESGHQRSGEGSLPRRPGAGQADVRQRDVVAPEPP